MKSLVTGGAGFIGSHLVDKLLEQGNEVLVIDNLSTGKKEHLNPKAIFFEQDLRDFNKIKSIFEGVDFVFHLAALPRVATSIEKPLLTNEINITGTLNVLQAANEAKVKKVIYASSTSVYGNQKTLPIREDAFPSPLSPYGLQKYVGELYCKIYSDIYKLATVCLRYFNVFGPRQNAEDEYAGVTAKFLKLKKQGKPLTIVGDGEQKRDFTSVFDVVRATVLAAEKEVPGGEAINIASGKNYSINQLADIIGGEKEYIPERPGEIRNSLADISKAKELLGWQPEYDLEKGLKEMMKETDDKKEETRKSQ